MASPGRTVEISGGSHASLVIRLQLLVIAGWFVCSSIGCGPAKITSDVLLPAKAHEASKIKRLAVLPFTGTSDVSSEVEARLVNTRVQGQPYFTVVERTALDKILKEHTMGLSGVIDETTATKVGKLAGAEGVILGVVQTKVEHKPYQETRSKCTSQDKNGKCLSQSEYTVQCTKSDAYFSLTPKMVEVATGRILASEVLVGHDSQQRCADSAAGGDAIEKLAKMMTGDKAKKGGSGMRGDAEMLGIAKEAALEQLQHMVAPHYVKREFAILEEDDTKAPAAAKEKVAQGIKWAKEGRLDRACELWQDAYGLHQQGYAIHYNLGLCAEMVGKLPEALEYYEKADRLTGKPVKEINEALGRIRQSMVQQRQLVDQMQKEAAPPPTEEPRRISTPPPPAASSSQPKPSTGKSGSGTRK